MFLFNFIGRELLWRIFYSSELRALTGCLLWIYIILLTFWWGILLLVCKIHDVFLVFVRSEITKGLPTKLLYNILVFTFQNQHINRISMTIIQLLLHFAWSSRSSWHALLLASSHLHLVHQRTSRLGHLPDSAIVSLIFSSWGCIPMGSPEREGL